MNQFVLHVHKHLHVFILCTCHYIIIIIIITIIIIVVVVVDIVIVLVVMYNLLFNIHFSPFLHNYWTVVNSFTNITCSFSLCII